MWFFFISYWVLSDSMFLFLTRKETFSVLLLIRHTYNASYFVSIYFLIVLIHMMSHKYDIFHFGLSSYYVHCQICRILQYQLQNLSVGLNKDQNTLARLNSCNRSPRIYFDCQGRYIFLDQHYSFMYKLRNPWVGFSTGVMTVGDALVVVEQ